MRRSTSAALVVAIVALGAASRLVPLGNSLWDKSLGDVAYAMVIAFILAFLRPHGRSAEIGGQAIAICIALELFQLTGLPRRAPRLLQVVLGTTFAWHDLVCYVVGGVVAALVHERMTRPKNAKG